MTSNTLSYADMPVEKLSRATSLGGVLQQLSVSFGVSVSAMLLGLVTWQNQPLTPARFHEVFLLMAVISLLSLPGFIILRPEDGREVSGHHRDRNDGNLTSLRIGCRLFFPDARDRQRR